MNIKNNIKALSLLLVYCFAYQVFHISSALAEAKKIGKIKMARGNIIITDPDTKEIVSPKVGNWVKEGSTIETKASSFIKIVFTDQSSLNVAPKSKMVITKFAKKEPGLINLIEGTIRSTVKKDILKSDDAKLYIQTKSAALGVRGTILQATYRPGNNSTSCLTFQGTVDITNFAPGVIIQTFTALRDAFRAANPTRVHAGQVSMTSPTQKPKSIKINPVQLKLLQRNESASEAPANKGAKIVKSITPPGLSKKLIMISNAGLVQSMAKESGFFKAVATIEKEKQPTKQPEKQEVTVFFDPTTNLIIPETIAGMPTGKIDSTGDFIPPVGTRLTTEGFKPDKTVVAFTSFQSPAGLPFDLLPPPPQPEFGGEGGAGSDLENFLNLTSQIDFNDFETIIELAEFEDENVAFSSDQLIDSPYLEEQFNEFDEELLNELIEETQDDIENDLQEAQESNSLNSRVFININL